MAKERNVIIPIVCWTDGCKNFGKEINTVTDIKEEDLDLFFEGYDGSSDSDYCPICGEMGVAEDAYLK